MVVRSPASLPSQIAWIERRSSFPDRVFGSAVMKCTRAGRAILAGRRRKGREKLSA